MDVIKFQDWLIRNGAEILPATNEYELMRFKGSEVGVFYKSGKTNGAYASRAYTAFKYGRKWDGKPINTGRKNTYKKEKTQLLKRDGDRCFYCGEPLEEDITLEHLISLSSGGKNSLSNMVLAHEKCNNEVHNLHLNIKVEMAIKKRSKL